MKTNEAITQLIKEREETFRISTDNIISQFRGDLQYTKDYNGRQILELLQNADDAGSDIFEIEIDTRNKKLSVSNTGVPFNTNGIKSLMIPNLSEKNKKEFIGNKGLGFRSILNWAESVQIFSGDINVEFSPELARQNFERLVPDADARATLQTQRDLPEGVVPFPVLAIPKLIAPGGKQGFATTICIKYMDGFEKDILQQVNALKAHPEAMLFLNHINTIRLIIDGEPTPLICVDSPSGEYPTKTIGTRTWNIADSGENLLPDGKTWYRLKLAWQDDLSDNFGKLFTFLPTSVSLYLPYLVHGTFELEANRKHITDSEENKHILNELLQLIKKVAQDLCLEKTDWRPWRVLTPDSVESDSPALRVFYKDLTNLKNDLSVFPCVDDGYRISSMARYYTPELSQWVKRKKYEQFLPELLLSPDIFLKQEQSPQRKKYPPDDFISKINELSRSITDIVDRADLILFALAEKDTYKWRFDLLVNDKMEIVSADVTAFTPVKKGEKFHVPDFIQIDFINEELYDQLVRRVGEHFDEKTAEEREFQSYFKSILNVQPYDSNNVIDKIMTNTRSVVEDLTRAANLEEARNKVRITLQELFKNYKNLQRPQEVFGSSIPLIASDHSIVESDQLFLSEEFEAGSNASRLYGHMLTANRKIAGVAHYQLPNDDMVLLESFFVWLGVTRYVRYSAQETSNDWNYDPYFQFILKNNGESLSDFRMNRLNKNSKVRVPEDWDLLQLMDPANLLVLLCLDNNSKIEILSEHFSYEWYYNKPRPAIVTCYSYVCFKLLALGKFADILIEEVSDDIAAIVNKEWNSLACLMANFKIDMDLVRRVLLKLGAKATFREFSLDKVYGFIKEAGEKRVSNDIAGKIYDLAFQYFKEKKDSDFEGIEKKFDLLAFKKDKKEYQPNDTVYYSDNKTLPTRILERYWILDFPRRSGEKQLVRYFGINAFRSINFHVSEQGATYHNTDHEFKNWVRQIRTYILAHRIRTIKSDKGKAANDLLNLKIELVSSLQYSDSSGAVDTLEMNEFIIDVHGTFYLRAETSKKLEALKSTPRFCDAVAEIYCILFEVTSGKNTYRSIFKDPIDDTKNLIATDGLDAYFDEAKRLLGISESELAFWDAILAISGQKRQTDVIADREELSEMIITQLGYNLPETYERIDFNKFDNQEAFGIFSSLHMALGISLFQIKEHLNNFPALENYYRKKLENITSDTELQFNLALWLSLQRKEPEQQLRFESIRSTYHQQSNKIINELCVSHACDLHCDYRSIFIQRVGGQYDLDLKELPENRFIQNLYPDLKVTEYDYTDEDRSRFYFNGNEDYLRALKEKIQRPDVAVQVSADISDSRKAPLVVTSIDDGDSPPMHDGRKTRRPGTHSSKKEKRQKEAGLNAERLVRDTLVSRYGRSNVVWLSGNSEEENVKRDDGAGYDIRYRTAPHADWLFLEVKSLSGQSFVISANEVNVAMANKEKYCLALVREAHIFLVPDYFQKPERQSTFERLLGSGSIRPLNFEIFINLPDSVDVDNRSVVEELDTLQSEILK